MSKGKLAALRARVAALEQLVEQLYEERGASVDTIGFRVDELEEGGEWCRITRRTTRRKTKSYGWR